MLEAAERRDNSLANLRLAVALVGVAMIWLALLARVLPPIWLVLPGALYMGLVFAHGGVLRQRDRLARAVEVYESGLARLTDLWRGQGRTGEEYADEDHLYAVDLDVVGPGSLFQRISTARTAPGEETLARWLLEPEDFESLASRQEAVAELRGRLDLRESAALLGDEVSFEISSEQLEDWGGASPVVTSTRSAWLAGGVAGLNVLALVAWWRLPWGSLPLLPALIASGAFVLIWRRRVGAVLAAARHRHRELSHFAQLLHFLESETFSADGLLELQARVRRVGFPASRMVRLLAQLLEWNESRRNILFLPIAGLLLLESQLAFAVERWRADAGSEAGGWLRAVGEFEALCSLAAFAFENPDDCFPELEPGAAIFVADGLGHPLLSRASCVRNDLELGGSLRLLLVSGSNMSGKSTLLRSVGVNAVLAQAGATVRARRLRISPLRVGASLTVGDSLAQGTSRFYAEISRLRAIAALGEASVPLLFLLDEILHGTNSHDRRIGAEGVIRSLLAGEGIGLVTTHDLALAEIAEDLGSRAANVHFEDRIDGGRMVFDYKLRRGVVDKSNALSLMRELGLDV